MQAPSSRRLYKVGLVKGTANEVAIRRNSIAAMAVGAILYLQVVSPARAQSCDIPSRAADSISSFFDGKLKLSFEQRERFESRTENSFGSDVDSNSLLVRTRM